ncbi:glycosyltransferase family 2 protein [Parvibaculum sp.]|uniref:glycosyltransferase family 2 protein n=1 Tax=Parvibaculum sp. TaxID=2024848 RepID=UPI00391AA380
MTQISIGVPVFNGAKSLDAVLECLRVQTFTDFEVIISDNGSTDGSKEIAAGFAARDSRFRLVEHAHNIGAKNNFLSLVEEANCDLFIWRADDDLCDPDFLAILKRHFDSNPELALAAPRVKFVHDDGSPNYEEDFQILSDKIRPLRIGDALMGASSSWIFGLWKRDALRHALEITLPTYPYVWGWDPLTLLPPLLDERVETDANALLIKKSISTARYRWQVPAREMWEMRRAFSRTCFIAFRQRDWTLAERVIVGVYVFRFANLRVYRFWKTVRAQMREWLGLKRRQRRSVEG